MPGALDIAVLWSLSLAVCVVLSGRRLSLTRRALSVGVSQLLSHILFVLGTLTPGPPRPRTCTAARSCFAGQRQMPSSPAAP